MAIGKIQATPLFHDIISLNLVHGFNHISLNQVVYAMGLKPPFSKRVFLKVKIMTDGRNVDVISGTFS